jgi:ATPase subunit of ABC transporter with duplicated ATPase domains
LQRGVSFSDENPYDVDIQLGDWEDWEVSAQAKNGVFAENGKGSSTIIRINPKQEKMLYGDVPINLGATVIHEMAGHAYNHAKGIATTSSDRKSEEQDATYIENVWRAYFEK